MEDAGWRPQDQKAAEEQLNQLRTAIDTLDQTIAALLVQRLSLSTKIGEVKAQSGIAVKDNNREEQVLTNVRSVTEDQQKAQALANIYAGVINESCRLQKSIATPPEPATAASAYFPRVLIIGLGMIGGALARKIKAVLPATHVTAVDAPATLEQALSQQVIDQGESDLSKAVKGAGLILLCANPAANMQILRQLAPLTKRRQIIVDVTSTKRQICDLADELALKADFVGGHPLFGSQNSGFQAAREVIVDGKRFCLVPTRHSSELTLRRLARWFSDLGLQVVQIQPDAHDAALARTSHNVQLLCTALGASLARGRNDEQLRTLRQLSGPSFDSLVRLMSSPSEMWLDIIRQNREQICQGLTELIEELRATRTDVALDNEANIQERFQQAARIPKSKD